MKVIELKAENFKRLEAVEISPSGDMVVVSGPNAAGKSSVVDSIFAALQARAILKEIPQPVREGQGKATITLNLGDYIVERTIKPDGKTTLKVTTGEGVPIRSPQAAIDGLLGSLSIDPSVFIRLKAGDQVSTLVELVDTEGFLAKNDAQHEAWYNHRTTVGRTRDQNKAVLNATPQPNVPEVKPNVHVLKERVDDLRKNNLEYAEMQRIKGDWEDRVNSIAARITEQQKALEEAKESLTVVLNSMEHFPERGDVDAAEAEWREGVEQLAEYDKVDAWNAASEAHEKAEGEYADATTNLDTLKQNRQTWLAKAVLPVDGLGFDFDVPCVTYNGLPLQQASSSEQLKVGTAIAMAQNPELRVIRVSDGNCLDSTSFAMLAEMAAASDFQLWIEKVDETGDIGFYIEDGKLVAVDGEPVGQ